MKCHIALLMVFVNVLLHSCHSYSKTVDKTHLYPFMKDDKWGFCTEDKQIVIPCAYESFAISDKYYIGINKSGGCGIYNNNAVKVEMADHVHFMQHNTILLLDDIVPNEVEQSGKKDKQDDVFATIHRMEAEANPFDYVNGCKGWILDSSGKKTAVPDTIIAVSKYKELLWCRNGNIQGIYNAYSGTYFIEPAVQHIRLISDYYFLTIKDTDGRIKELYETDYFKIAKDIVHYSVRDMDGKVYKFPPQIVNAVSIFEDGKFFETRSSYSSDRAIYNTAGKQLAPDSLHHEWMKSKDGKTFGYVIQGHFKPGTDYSRNGLARERRFFDTAGKMLVDIIGNIDPAGDKNLMISPFDTLRNVFKPAYLYNPFKKKVLLQSEGDNTYISKDKLLLFMKLGSNSNYYDFDGKLLLSLNDSMLRAVPEEAYMYHVARSSEIYIALRRALDKPFTLYSQDLKIITQGYDTIIAHAYNYHLLKCFIVKRAGKWGLLNEDFKPLINPEYEQLRFGYNDNLGEYLHVIKNGKGYWIDTTGKVLFGGKDYDYVSSYEVNSKRLALKYKPTPDVAIRKHILFDEADKAFIIDSIGNILSEWEGSSTNGYYYALTPNGKMMRYPKSDYDNYSRDYGEKLKVQLYDPATQKEETMNENFTEALLYNGMPWFISSRNSKGQLALFSALNLDNLISYGKYQNMFINTNIMSMRYMQKGMFLEVVKYEYLKEGEEMSGFPTLNDRDNKKLLGYYTADGEKYWDE